MSKTHKLAIPSIPDKIVDVDVFAEEQINRMGFTQDQRDDIAIALSEAVNNAIEHGNEGDPAKMVTIELEELGTGVRIRVIDQGDGFNPEQVADPTDPDNLLAESGRGLLIIRHLMDEVNVIPSKKGTKVEMFKKFKV